MKLKKIAPAKVECILSIEERNRVAQFFSLLIKIERRVEKNNRKNKQKKSSKIQDGSLTNGPYLILIKSSCYLVVPLVSLSDYYCTHFYQRGHHDRHDNSHINQRHVFH